MINFRRIGLIFCGSFLLLFQPGPSVLASETAPPLRSSGFPTGSINTDTARLGIMVSLSTDEDATCKYSSTPGVTYSAMNNTFSTTGANLHAFVNTGFYVGGNFTFYIKCQDAWGNTNTDDYLISFLVGAVPQNFTAPGIYNSSPSGNLPNGTTQVTISLKTNEVSACRYSFYPETNFFAMSNAFSSTGGTSHSQIISGLAPGDFTFYVRCVDTGMNTNATDYPISFTIQPDITPPVRSNGSPSGTLAPGTTQATISLNTNEDAICWYQDSYAPVYLTFGGWKTYHSRLLIGLAAGTHSYNILCQDKAVNQNTTSFVISFTIPVPPDTTPPVRSSGFPSGTLVSGTTQVNLSLGTNEGSTCKYSTLPGVAYSSATGTFSTTGGTTHSKIVSGLSNGVTYIYYIRCQDASGNANVDDYTISFSVSAGPTGDTTPPVRSNGSPSGTLSAEVTQTTVSLSTSESATCKYSTASGISYASMANTFTTTGGTSHSKLVTGLSIGPKNYYVKCQDTAGNANADDFIVSFSIGGSGDTTPPVRSNGSPTGSLASGTTQVTLSLATDESATCKYSTTSSTSYSTMTNTFTTTGGTSHSKLVTGLSIGPKNYYVKCQDTAGNANADDFIVSFSIGGSGDTTPPVRSNGSPTGTISSASQITVALSTSESATCKYSTASGIPYSSMTNTFTTTGGTSHYKVFTGLSNSSHSYNVRCQDASGNTNAEDYPITFTISNSADTTPPVRSNGSPTGSLASGTTQVTLSLATDESATCKYSTTSSTSYSTMTNTFTTTGGTSHSKTVTGLSNGSSYSYYVRCQDSSGNKNTDSYAISFSVGSSGPNTYQFNKNLYLGIHDPDVVYLKQLLAEESCVTGLSNTDYFGTQTRAGVICFQNKYKTEISAIAGYTIQATGFFGIATRTFVNSRGT